MAHEEIYRELAECLASGEFVAYHKWGDDPSILLVGVVQKLSPTKAVFRDINPRGVFEEELHAVPLRLIHTLDRGTLYLLYIRVLHELGPVPVEQKDVRKASEIRDLMQEAAKEGAIVRIWTSAEDSEDVVVLSISYDTATVSSVFDAGPRNGRMAIRLKRIMRVRWSQPEADATRVHRYAIENGFL